MIATGFRHEPSSGARQVATTHVSGLPDVKDAPFLEVALAAGVPLVTGNADHFPASHRRLVEVVPPAAYLERLAP